MSVLIIAEAGVNHNGDLQLAKQLVRSASEAGADYVKFQTFSADKLVNRAAEKAEYQKRQSSSDESQWQMLKKLQLTEEEHLELVEHCKVHSIKFLSTPFDSDSLRFLQHIGVARVKLSSGDLTNYPLLKAAASSQLPVIVSTGMATMAEVAATVELLLSSGMNREDLTLLHCNTEYPTPYTDVNLRAMLTLRDAFKVEVGYSDHTMGIEVPIAAVAMGAKIIEKHLTLDKRMEGPDHAASLEPQEFVAMVRSIRNIEQSMGTGIKEPSSSEKKNIDCARKSIVAAYPIKKGDILTEDNLTVKRPGSGLSPMLLPAIIGTRAVKDLQADEQLCLCEGK